MAIQFLSMREEWPKRGNVQESPSDTFINETQREKKKTKQNREIKENWEFRQKHPKITHYNRYLMWNDVGSGKCVSCKSLKFKSCWSVFSLTATILSVYKSSNLLESGKFSRMKSVAKIYLIKDTMRQYSLSSYTHWNEKHYGNCVRNIKKGT